MNWEAIKPLAVLIFTSLLKIVGGVLMTHGVISAGPGLETFTGVAMTAGGAVWSWWVQSGHLQAAAYLKKLTDTATQAAAIEVAKRMPSAAITGAAEPAKAAVEKAGTPTLVPPITPLVLLAVLALAALTWPGDASAQGLPKIRPLTGNIVNDIAAAKSDPAVTPSGSKIGDSGCKATGDPIADLHCVIKAGGAKLILHLKQSYALASAPGASSGSTTDNTSAMCTKALVPIVDLVVNGPKSGTIPASDPMALTADEQALASNASELDGPIVVIEKIRILRLAIQSPALNDACGALVQDEVKNAQSLVGKVTSLITGAGILAPIGL
jgi:hypothetical protein